jgi:hypothetical protein
MGVRFASGFEPTQMAIPLQMELVFRSSWSLQCDVLEGSLPTGTF